MIPPVRWFGGGICRNFDRPVLALGGINADNIHLAMVAGASGVALIRGILD
ncbi:MAG TPA: hypothetical protein HPQ00_01530 [Magnetococcales bacterium]|nr:hypothetical protein [Magnetococcales bacterium]